MHSKLSSITGFLYILCLMFSCSGQKKLPEIEKQPRQEPKTIAEYLDQVRSASASEYNSGDSIQYISGDLFKTGEKYALTATIKSHEEAIYSLYDFKNDQWNLIFCDTPETMESIDYRIEDFDFDGKLDLAFQNIVNMNGNQWFTLYRNLNGKFVEEPSFRDITNPIIDPVNQTIFAQYMGGTYDQHSKDTWKFRNDDFVIIEMVTIDPVYDKHNEPTKRKVCHYKDENGKLKRQFCKTATQDKSYELYEQLVPEIRMNPDGK